MGTELTKKTGFEGQNYLGIFGINTSVFSDAALYEYKRIIESSYTGRPEKGNLRITATVAEASQALEDHLASYISATEIEDVTDTYESSDQTTYKTGRDETKRIGFLYIAAKANHDDENEVIIGTGFYGGATGDKSEGGAGASLKKQLELVADVYDSSDLTINATTINSITDPSGNIILDSSDAPITLTSTKQAIVEYITNNL